MIACVGVAVLLALVAQVSAALALVMTLGMIMAGVALVFGRVEYLLNVLVVVPFFERGVAGQITTGRVATVGAVGALVALLLLTDWRPLRSPLHLWVPSIALFSWAILSGFWAASADYFLAGLGQLGVAVAFLVVMALGLPGVAVFTSMMRTYVVVGALMCVPATLQAMTGSRAIGLTENPNDFAAALVLAVLALAYLIRLRGPYRRSRGLILLAPVLAWGVVLTGSRMGLLALTLASFLVAFDMAPRSKRVPVMVGALAILAVGFIALITASDLARNRFDPRLAAEDRGAGRLDIWLVAVRQTDSAPLQGAGLRNFGPQASSLLASEPGVQATGGQLLKTEDLPIHNTYLDMLLELGAVGLLLFLWTLGQAVAATRRCRHPAWRGPARTLVLQMFLLVSFMIIFSSGINYKWLWMLIGISIAMNGEPRADRRATGSRVSPSLQIRDPRASLVVR